MKSKVRSVPILIGVHVVPGREIGPEDTGYNQVFYDDNQHENVYGAE